MFMLMIKDVSTYIINTIFTNVIVKIQFRGVISSNKIQIFNVQFRALKYQKFTNKIVIKLRYTLKIVNRIIHIKSYANNIFFSESSLFKTTLTLEKTVHFAGHIQHP